MKFCESCGEKNATGAAFCQRCGSPFRIADSNSAESSVGSLQKLDEVSRQNDAFGEATKEFAAVVGASVLTIVVAFARWFYRLIRPLARTTVGFAWEQVKFWGVLGAFLWRLPTSWVGIVYAILANEGRRSGEFDLARARAESAKNWLIADFVVGLVVCVFRNLVL